MRWIVLTTMFFIYLTVSSAVAQAPVPLPMPDDGGCKLLIINGKACVVCQNIVQC